MFPYFYFYFMRTGQYMFAGGRSAFIDIWFLSRPAILGSIITNKDSDRSLRCSAPRVFERVQMPNSSTMIRKLSWIPRGFLLVKNKPFKSNDPDDNEQVNCFTFCHHSHRLIVSLHYLVHYIFLVDVDSFFFRCFTFCCFSFDLLR